MIWQKITLIKRKKKNKIINEIRINITIYVFYYKLHFNTARVYIKLGRIISLVMHNNYYIVERYFIAFFVCFLYLHKKLYQGLY